MSADISQIPLSTVDDHLVVWKGIAARLHSPHGPLFRLVLTVLVAAFSCQWARAQTSSCPEVSGLSTNSGPSKKAHRRWLKASRRRLTVTFGWELSPDCFALMASASNDFSRRLASNSRRQMFPACLLPPPEGFGSAIVSEPASAF